MITGIITSFKEPRTICKCIANILQSFITANVEFEIIVLAPDEETLKEARSYQGVKTKVRVVRDPGKGKPCALNMAFKEAKGDIMILTDGDTYISAESIKELLKVMNDPKVGAVSGRPVSTSPKNSMLGFWSHLLTDMAHKTRMDNTDFVVSGYLYALRKGILDDMPEQTLSDDAYNSFKLVEKGWKIGYCPEAQVYVKYPSTFKDWLAQKKRSAGGFVQLTSEFKMTPPKSTRSFGQEVKGFWDVISYAKTPEELGWTLALIGARVWMWMNIFWERKIMHKDFNKTWTRIESTK